MNFWYFNNATDSASAKASENPSKQKPNYCIESMKDIERYKQNKDSHDIMSTYVDKKQLKSSGIYPSMPTIDQLSKQSKGLKLISRKSKD